jgi:hypothetical protein
LTPELARLLMALVFLGWIEDLDPLWRIQETKSASQERER